MWPLDRLGLAVEVGDRVVLAGERERAVGEAALEHRDRLLEPGLAHRRGVERQADGVVLGLVPAGPDGHVQAPAAQDVEAREVLGEHRRMAQVVVVHEGRDPEAVRGGGDGRQRRDRRQLLDQVVRDDEGVIAHRLRPPRFSGEGLAVHDGLDGRQERERPGHRPHQAVTRSAIARRWAGVLPQQPPMIVAPASRIRSACAAISAGSDL